MLADTGMPGCRQAANGRRWLRVAPGSRTAPQAAARLGLRPVPVRFAAVARGLLKGRYRPGATPPSHRRPHHGQPFDP
ncbi:protein of unknown function [Cupriavidus taiwanensis]|uniref:Uncharacterized protein n=1 Tax=Cupriavidus taiwanensis TaxID=164546 RepID=A0A7Z7JB53_9BURK|nr:hypothetical protein CBM2594_A70608 [Cupriavidus taiwanensis]SPD40762.1 protein of unknown function [Cupriavidus taiwanensis]